MHVCGVLNKKLVSLACMPNEQKVQNVKMASISVCICMCACVYVYLFLCVCDVPNIKLLSLAFMPNKPKSEKYKNGICIYVCMFLCVSVFLCVWYVIYELIEKVHLGFVFDNICNISLTPIVSIENLQRFSCRIHSTLGVEIKKRFYISVPYFPGLSESYKKIFKYMPIQVCFKGVNTQINANAPKRQNLQWPNERFSLPLGMQGRWV